MKTDCLLGKIIVLKRVSYASSKTPIKSREYRAPHRGPVGTKKEWKDWAKKLNEKIQFKE